MAGKSGPDPARGVVELEISGQMAKEALRGGPRSLVREQRVRLPFRWTPDPVAKEREFLSLRADEYVQLHDRARALGLRLALAISELPPRGLRSRETINALTEVRRDAAMWKAMLLAVILDGSREPKAQEAIVDYFDSKRTLGVTIARILGIDGESDTQWFEQFALNAQIPGIRLDPLSDAAVLRLRADEVLHAQRTANNAKVMEIYFFVVMGIIAGLEMGLAQVILTMARFGGGPAIAEGFGVATAQGSLLAQGVFGGFMGFIGYLERVGEVMADGEFTQDEELGLNLAFLGIFLPIILVGARLGSLPGRIQRFAAFLGTATGLTLYAAATLNSVLWAVQSVGELIEGLDYAAALEEKGVAALVAGDAEFEILIPPLP